jgi:hypothetical protein
MSNFPTDAEVAPVEAGSHAAPTVLPSLPASSGTSVVRRQILIRLPPAAGPEGEFQSAIDEMNDTPRW